MSNETTYVTRLFTALKPLTATIHVQVNPGDESAASKELLACSSGQEREVLKMGWSMADLWAEYAAEHLGALSGLAGFCGGPTRQLVFFTCVRSMLEACASTRWLTVESINRSDRVARILACRYSAIVAQLKAARSLATEDLAIQGQVDAIKTRIDSIESLTVNLGHRVLRNGKGKRVGIGVRLPAATNQIRDMLGSDAEHAYRLYSGLARSLTSCSFAGEPLARRLPRVSFAGLGMMRLLFAGR